MLSSYQGAEYVPVSIFPGTTWDPTWNASSATYSGGNLTATTVSVSGVAANVRSTTTRSTGKYYVEVIVTSIVTNGFGFAVGTTQTNNQYIGFDTHTYGILQNPAVPDVVFVGNGSTSSTLTTALTTGDVLGIAVNIGVSLIVYRNGISLGTFPYTPPSNSYYVFAGTNYNTTNTNTVNFGDTAFSSTTAPIRSALANQGYVAWDGQSLNPGAVFATWDPAKTGTAIVLTGSNLVATSPNGAVGSSLSTVGKSSSKWYWEEVINATTPPTFPNFGMGIGTSSVNVNNNLVGDPNAWSYVPFASSSYIYHTSFVPFGTYPVTGDKIGIALDMDTGIINFYRNGVLMTPSPAFTGLSGTFFASIGNILGDQYSVTANFGASLLTGVGGTGFPPPGFFAGLF